jgi:hypothetical protein
MHALRLTVLAEALEMHIPVEKFDLGSWRNDHRPTGFDTSDEALLHACGTTACAVGHACALPALKDQGLYWDKQNSIPRFTGFEPDSEEPRPENWDIAWGSVQQFFGLTQHQTWWLFSAGNYEHDDGTALPGLPLNKHGCVNPEPKHVAHRIRHLLAGKPTSDHTFEEFQA